MLQYLVHMESDILIWIQNMRLEWLNPIVIFITRLGDGGFIWIISSLALLIPKKTRKVGAMALMSLALSVLIDNVLLKNLIARTRPYDVVAGLNSLIGVQKDYSFPSGHTGSSFAVAVVLYKMLPKIAGIPAIILAMLIGFSRLYVGVHYPSDVLCGLLIGTGIALLVCWACKMFLIKKNSSTASKNIRGIDIYDDEKTHIHI